MPRRAPPAKKAVRKKAAKRKKDPEVRRKAAKKRARWDARGVKYTPVSQVVGDGRMQRSKIAATSRYTLTDITDLTDKDAYRLLVDLGFLRDLGGSPCPRCEQPLPRPLNLRWRDGMAPHVRCTAKQCRKEFSATNGTWARHRAPIRKQAAAAWLASGMCSAQIGYGDAALMLGISGSTRKDIWEDLRKLMVSASRVEQSSIKLFGECEGDATTVRVVNLANGRNVHIRAWVGVRRGDMTTLCCYPLPSYTTCRGTATRPESRIEVEPFIKKHASEDKLLIWHSDGARAYRYLPNHTSVKHQRKVWVARKKLRLEGGDVLWCVAGTCLIDGLWSHLKGAIPKTTHTYTKEDQARLGDYMYAWAWKTRRQQKPDLFAELGASIALATK